MANKRRIKPRRGRGTITSLPMNDGADGYGFITTESGEDVYVSALTIAEHDIRRDDLGRDVRLKYIPQSRGRFMAVTVRVMPDIDDLEDIEDDLSNEIARLLAYQDDLESLMENITNCIADVAALSAEKKLCNLEPDIVG